MFCSATAVCLCCQDPPNRSRRCTCSLETIASGKDLAVLRGGDAGTMPGLALFLSALPSGLAASGA